MFARIASVLIGAHSGDRDKLHSVLPSNKPLSPQEAVDMILNLTTSKSEIINYRHPLWTQYWLPGSLETQVAGIVARIKRD